MLDWIVTCIFVNLRHQSAVGVVNPFGAVRQTRKWQTCLFGAVFASASSKQ